MAMSCARAMVGDGGLAWGKEFERRGERMWLGSDEIADNGGHGSRRTSRDSGGERSR